MKIARSVVSFDTQTVITLIVTIDGPAGAGKSSIAHQVASELGFEFLDTGAMYRAATYAALRAGLDLDDADQLATFVSQIHLAWEDRRIFLDGDDISGVIRTPEITASIRFLADVPGVRRELSSLQRNIADGRNIVTEGRDQGAEVFPEADCKIFLTASAEERAKRRMRQLAETGRYLDFQEVLDAQNQRDREDESRDVGRLRAADDAIIVNSDGMRPDEVLDQIVSIVRAKIQD